MTDNDINRAIAESLGWKAEPMVGVVYRDGTKGTAIRWHDPSCKFGVDFDCSTMGMCGFKAPDFLTDPAARDLLVRKMLEEGKTILISPVYNERSGRPTGEYSLQVENTFPVNEVVCIIFDTYGRIWPLAYLKTIPAAEEKA